MRYDQHLIARMPLKVSADHLTANNRLAETGGEYEQGTACVVQVVVQ